jgi:hypothetical protein
VRKFTQIALALAVMSVTMIGCGGGEQESMPSSEPAQTEPAAPAQTGATGPSGAAGASGAAAPGGAEQPATGTGQGQ